jgi:SAM-dependent methyltransferase
VTLDRPTTVELITSVQDIISAALPGSGYVTSYRDEEIGYWSPALAWIDEMPTGSAVLDIGCAYGTLALYAKERLGGYVLAVDAIEQQVIGDLLRSRDVDYARCNVELESLPTERDFDLVLFTETIEHLNFHPLPTLEKIRSVLRPNGRLVVSTPDADSAWGRVTKYYAALEDIPPPTTVARNWIDDHVWQFDRRELREVIEAAGFEIRELRHSSRKVHEHLVVLATKT